MSIVIQPVSATRMSTVIDRRGSAGSGDDCLDAFAKLVPGEMLLAFTLVMRMQWHGSAWISHGTMTLLLTALLPFGLWWSARRRGSRAHALQHTVRVSVFVLYGLGCDDVLRGPLEAPQWIFLTGALVVPMLAALVLCPPGAQNPPPHNRNQELSKGE